MNNKFKKIIIVCAIGIIAISGILILYYFNIGIPCIFYKITNLYCPGCGITRAIISLLKLNIYQAVRYNSLIILFPFLLINYIYTYVFNGKKKVPQFIWIIILVIVILYGVLRNIPKFSFLAPVVV